jgi:hypothetical protein
MQDQPIELEEEKLDGGEPAGVEAETDVDDAEIKEPFDPEKIKVSNDKKTVDLIMRRIDHGEIDLAPPFQRKAGIWDSVRKSRLIESMLLRIPLPVFYVASDQNENWAVVDGLQRLTAVHDFIQGLYALNDLEYLKDQHGKGFKDLPRRFQRRIEETELVINVIEAGTPDAVMINIFKRINTAGMTLNGQEIRHALHKGPVRSFLKELAESEAFRRATMGSVRDDRMAARECALRFLAFWMTPWEGYASNDLDGFLSDAMRQINRSSPEEREELRRQFERAMNAAQHIFENDAFRKRYDESHNRKPISKALFEAWSVNLARLSDGELERLTKRKGSVRHGFISLMNSDRDFDVAISYSTGVPRRVEKRFSAVKDLIQDQLQ